MPDPVHTPLGARLRERTQPLAPDDDQYGYAHAHLCEGMMRPFSQVAELVDPPDPWDPWEILFSPAYCPVWALPWLGQTVGVRLSRSMTEAEMRTAIKELGGAPLGSPRRIRAAIEMTLDPGPDGLKHVYFRERDGGEAYYLEVVTPASETPDPEATERAVIENLPAAIGYRVRTIDGWDYQAMTFESVTTGGTYAEQTATFDTYADLSLNIRIP